MSRRIIVPTLCLLILLFSCKTPSANPYVRHKEDPFIAEGDYSLNNKRKYGKEHVANKNHGISEIGISRGACLGSCPVDSFIIRSDGTFVYFGYENVPNLGKRTGRILGFEFDRLANLLIDAKILKNENIYTFGMVDGPGRSFLITVNNEKIFISDDGAGPTSLWATNIILARLRQQSGCCDY